MREQGLQTEREGPRSQQHGLAPRTQLWTLCFCVFCHHFAASQLHRELQGQVGQEAGGQLRGGQLFQVGTEGRKGNATWC